MWFLKLNSLISISSIFVPIDFNDNILRQAQDKKTPLTGSFLNS